MEWDWILKRFRTRLIRSTGRRIFWVWLRGSFVRDWVASSWGVCLPSWRPRIRLFNYWWIEHNRKGLCLTWMALVWVGNFKTSRLWSKGGETRAENVARAFVEPTLKIPRKTSWRLIFYPAYILFYLHLFFVFNF
jgi:hypothetical protein